RVSEGSKALRGPSRLEALLLALVAVLPFLNGLPADFTYDDKLIIRDDERIAEPSRVREIFTTQYFGGPLTSAQNYRPVVLLTYAVERWIHGNRPMYFRAVNIALHAAATVALAAWLLALGFPRGPSLAVSALFAVVPIHVEAVTSLVGRAEALSALLVLLAACLWIRATESGRLKAVPYTATLLLFLIAVFVKESAVVFPGLLVLGELFRGGRWRGLRATWRETEPRVRAALLGYLGPLAVLFAVRWIVLKGFLISREAGIWELENPLVALPAPLRIGNALTLAVRYVTKTLVPLGFSADHSGLALTLASSLVQPRAWGGALLLALVLAAAWRVRAGRPLALFGTLLFLGSLFPASNVPFVIGTIYAERLMYLPAAGVLAALTGFLSPPRLEVPRPSRWPWRPALLAATLLAWGAVAAARNLVWRDDRALFTDMVEKFPRSAKAHYNLAYDAGRRGDTALQKSELETAVTLFPNYYDAWASLGKIAWTEERWDEAIADYRRSVEISPTYENGCWGLAKTLEAAGRPDEARVAFDEAARAVPGSYAIAWHRAAFLEANGKLDEAVAEWRRAIPLGGGATSAHLALARLLVRRGKPGDRTEAWKEARRALVSDPACADARQFLAEQQERF
ncbi:MAG: tetratricopeptide repeat protein, partial [Acidithiobacillales bacterium]